MSIWRLFTEVLHDRITVKYKFGGSVSEKMRAPSTAWALSLLGEENVRASETEILMYNWNKFKIENYAFKFQDLSVSPCDETQGSFTMCAHCI